MTDFNRSLKLYPNNAIALTSVGLCYENMNEPKKAIDEFKLAIKVDPQHYSAYYSLGRLYNAIEDYASAKKYFCIIQWVCICFDLCTWASSHQNSSSSITIDMMLFPTSFPHSADDLWEVLSHGIIFFKSYEGVLVVGYRSPRAKCPDVTRRWDIHKTFLATSLVQQAFYWMKTYYSGLTLAIFWIASALSKPVICLCDFLWDRSKYVKIWVISEKH